MNVWSSAMLLGGGGKGFQGQAQIFRGGWEGPESGLAGPKRAIA